MIPANTVRLRDVADMAGVHPSTASRALNPGSRSQVNERTVVRVLEAARALGYQPNSLARGLKTNQTFTVGMLLPDLTNPLFPPIVRGVEDALGAADYTVILGNTDNDADKEASILRAMLNRRVDGLIVASARRADANIIQLGESGTPIVLVNRSSDNPHLPSISGDDHAGIGLAVRHLALLGHTKIAHVAGPQDLSTGLARYQSFVAWMQSEGLTPDPDRIVFSEWFHEAPGAVAAAELFERGVDFTAIVAANDLLAIGCYDVLAERGIRVPQDVSVVGYNDMPFSDKLNPPLTTIHIPHYMIGVRAAELALDLIAKRDVGGQAVRLAPSLMVRNSTAAIPT
ncbi:MAG: LacI family DNA-binding transcriptional regulator [Acidimicrobiia bacterium]|nr:LacI family DNA-binding transcriptional regulator [Acidimicrobiia bacterium]